MRIIILAFIISISLHFLAFNKHKDKEFEKKNQSDEKLTKKSDVKFVKLKKQEIKQKIEEEPKKVVEPAPSIPKAEEIKPIKKIVEKPIVKPIEKIVQKPVEQTIKKQVEKKPNNTKPIIENKNIQAKKQIELDKSKQFQEKVIKEQIVNKNSLQNSILEDFLSQKEPINKEILRELQKLYGEEYQSFTKVQKAYLEKNLNNFQVITQRVLTRLGYPKLAAKLRLSGINIVEFMYHPDGSITNLKITSSSGYEIFDKYSLELIEIAYKDYPKPTTSTKLKFNVNYQAY